MFHINNRKPRFALPCTSSWKHNPRPLTKYISEPSGTFKTQLLFSNLDLQMVYFFFIDKVATLFILFFIFSGLILIETYWTLSPFYSKCEKYREEMDNTGTYC